MKCAEAAALYTEPTNPRWIACHASLGEPPRAYTFMLWLGPYWLRFAKLHGVRDSRDVRLKLGADTDRLFDAWLRDQVDGQTSERAP